MSSNPEEDQTVSRRTALTSIAGAGAVALAGCTSADESGGDGLSGDISISGSSTVFPLMSALSEDFRDEHGDVNINVSPTGSGSGFSNYFCEGDADFNNASRPIRESEAQLCSDNSVEYVELRVATDALTIIVSNNNEFATELTVEELRQIWEADGAETWNEVNSEWPNEPIERFGAAETGGTFDYFNEAILEGAGHTNDYQATERDNNIITGVEGNEYAIGYLGYAYYSSASDSVTAVGIDDGNGPVQPNLDTAASGEYTPLSRPLFTYPSISSLGEEHVAEFARYIVEQATSEEVVANEVGYVPLTDSTQQEQMQTLEDAISQAQG